MNFYFITGIGADKKIFNNICLPEGCKAIHLDWIKPLSNETLESYAVRLAERIDINNPYILVGLSLGGMLATEIAKRYPPQELILISSIPSAKCLPRYFKVAGKLKLQHFVPISLLKYASYFKRFFTSETPEEKIYLRKVIRDTDSSFIRWALNAIINWKSAEAPASYVHIHGTRDIVLPIRYSTPTHVIKGGGHLMVLTRANEINNILREIYLSKLPVNYPLHT